MKYYKLIMDKDYSNGPKVKDWYGKINTMNIRYGFAHTFPDRMLFFVEDNVRLVYPSFVMFPFLMVNEDGKKVINMYDKNIPFKTVVLLEFQHKKMQLYFLPFLEHVDILQKSVENQETVYCLAISDKEFQQKSIFQIVENGKTETIVRLDIVESLLRRGLSGFSIEPIVVRGK